MSQLVRHIAGIPTATEQRCVRCCKVIARLSGGLINELCWFPGTEINTRKGAVDCTPVDLCERITDEEAVSRIQRISQEIQRKIGAFMVEISIK